MMTGVSAFTMVSLLVLCCMMYMADGFLIYDVDSLCENYCEHGGLWSDTCECDRTLNNRWQLDIKKKDFKFKETYNLNTPLWMLEKVRFHAREIASYCIQNVDTDPRCNKEDALVLPTDPKLNMFDEVKYLVFDSQCYYNSPCKLEYISTAFIERFKELQWLFIRNNRNLKIIQPFERSDVTNNYLSWIEYEGNNGVTEVKGTNALLAKLETFTYKAEADQAVDSLEIGAIQPGKSLRRFEITSKAKKLVVHAPIIAEGEVLPGVIKVDYKRETPDGEIEWKYDQTNGGITKMVLGVVLQSKATSYKSFIPKEMLKQVGVQEFQVDLNYLDKTPKEELSLHQVDSREGDLLSLGKNSVALDKITLDSLGYFPDMFPPEVVYALKQETITFNYLITNLEDAFQDVVAEAVKLEDTTLNYNYVINTQILIWDGQLVFRLNKVTVNFQMLLHYDDPQVLVLQPKGVPSALKFELLPMNLKRMYELMVATAIIGKPSQLDSGKTSEAKKIVLTKLLNTLKSVNPSMFQNVPAHQEYFVSDAFIKKTEVLLFLNRQVQNTSIVPRLSKSIYKEKTLAYQEMGKNLLQKEKFEKVEQGQKNLLRATKIKTQTQRLIAAKEQANLFNSHRQQVKVLKKFKAQREKYEKESKSLKGKFKEAVDLKETHAKVEAAFAVIDAVFSVFSGGVNGLKVIGAMAQSFNNIRKILKAINDLLKKISQLEQSTMKWFKKISSKLKNIGGFAAKVTTAQQALIISKAGFNPGDVTEMVNKVGEIDASDLLKWDTAIKDVETMMDSALTAEVPETYNYKKSLLRMMTAGRAETEATLKKVEIEANIALKEYEMMTYKEEEKKIDYLSLRMDQGVTSNAFDENFQLTTLQYKLEMFLHLVDYCDASFYYSLSPCDTYTNFQYQTSLEEIIHLTNKMLVEDVDNLNDLYPPPQSFFDKTIELNSKIGELIDEHKITFNIPLYHKQFNIFDRVRIEEVKIFIDGAQTTSGMLTVNIENSGLMEDRFKGQEFTFLADKWKRTFRYDLTSDKESYEIRGDIHKSYENHFNLPTPFSNWIVSIPAVHNEGLNLDNVKKIKIQLSGELIVSELPEEKEPPPIKFDQMLTDAVAEDIAISSVKKKRRNAVQRHHRYNNQTFYVVDV